MLKWRKQDDLDNYCLPLIPGKMKEHLTRTRLIKNYRNMMLISRGLWEIGLVKLSSFYKRNYKSEDN